MSARATVLPVLAGLAILAGACTGVLVLRGSGDEALRGAALGAGLGAAGIALEAFLLVRALALPRGQALRIVTAGFGIRMAVLACGALLLRDGSFADPASFALAFVGGFIAGIPVVGSIASTGGREPRAVAP